MRQYQAFWDSLKEHKTLRLEVKRDLHKRVVQGIKKEKAQDIGYRFICSDSGLRERMQVGSIDNQILIELISV